MGQVPVIVDTDAGLDDLLALGYLLAHPSIEVEAVTVAYGLVHSRWGGRNLARFLAACGHEHVPVYVGVFSPLQSTSPFPREWRQHCEELQGVELPEDYRPLESDSAEKFLMRRTGSKSEPVRILALGALSNLACLTVYGAPGLQEIVTMGGAFDVEGNLFETDDFDPPNATAEWNYFADPLAARMVLSSDLPVTVIPLDATCNVPISPALIDLFSESTHGEKAHIVGQVLELIRPFAELGVFFAWDCLAAVYLTNPKIVHVTDSAIHVTVNGANVGTTRRCGGGRPKQIADWGDVRLFEQLFIQAFT